jgi:CHAD domain-containing protein
MFSTSFRSLFIGLVLSAFLFALVGCGGRESSAQKLFAQGEYQKVIDKYPDLDVARRAHAKIADQLLQQKKYDDVLKQYSDTPAAYKAKMAMAQAMFDAGRYQAVIDSFPGSPLAAVSKDRIADSLFTTGQLDLLLSKFPDNAHSKQIKEERGTTELARIKKLRGDAKRQALETFMQTYSGTEAAKEAGTLLGKIREAEQKKTTKK